MKIWVDCDGVQASFHAAYLNVLNLVSERPDGNPWIFEDFLTFNDYSCFGEENAEWVWKYIDAQPGFVRDLEDLPGSRWGVEYLRTAVARRGGFVGCLTAPHMGPYWVPERYDWLKARGFTLSQICMSSNKGHAPGDVLIDDKYKNCTEWLKTSPNGRCFLLDAPYNQSLKHNDRIIRCDGWDEVISKLCL